MIDVPHDHNDRRSADAQQFFLLLGRTAIPKHETDANLRRCELRRDLSDQESPASISRLHELFLAQRLEYAQQLVLIAAEQPRQVADAHGAIAIALDDDLPRHLYDAMLRDLLTSR